MGELKSYTYTYTPKSEAEKMFDSFCESDRKAVFGTANYKTALMNLFDGDEEDMKKSIHEYLEWLETVDVNIGTYFKKVEDGSEWVVTCCYTDNSYDIVNATGEKIVRENIGLRDGKYEKISKRLEMIEY